MKVKSSFKTKGFKSWLFTAVPLTILLLTAGTVLTSNSLIYQTMNAVFGGERLKVKSGDVSKYQYYTADYKNKKEVLKAANELNEELVEEGIVLLKNNDNSLPLQKESKITVFGKNSTNLVLGGTGSNASSSGKNTKSIYDSLEGAGFKVNPKMRDFYQNDSKSGDGRPAAPGMNSTITGLTGFPIGETPVSKYDNEVKNSFKDYNDAAVVVISRIGGEGFDLPRSMFYDGKSYQNWDGDQIIPGARSKDDHYLQLDQNETDMLKLACENFDNVVVVLNSPTSMELGFLDDIEHYAYSDKIKSCLWLGTPGNTGVMALGRILNGEVNPSGRTVDTFARNFKDDPTWNNFSNNLTAGGNQYIDEEGKERNAYFVDYEEGIYVGYRYYETRGFTDGEQWYDDNVVYPFGYGLSYSDFSYNVINKTSDVLSRDSKIEFDVEVTNNGQYPGKDVVELYYTAPYYEGKIEKAHKVLGAFAKTDIINPGESQIVTLTMDARSMASYDYNDKNKNNHIGYELEEGEYVFSVSQNAHDEIEKFTSNLSSTVYYDNDSKTDTKIENLFDDVSERASDTLSRSDWEGTWPQKPTTEEKTLSKSDLKKLANYKVDDDEDDPYFSLEVPTQSDHKLTYEEAKIKLWNLIGKDYDDPMWDELLNQLTVEEMANLVAIGNYHTEAISSIDKPKTTDPDGPMGFSLFMGDPSVYNTCYYASESLVGATWNVKLAEEFGKMIGNESIIGNEKGDGRPYSGWYAPAVNLHRSQFSGRNFEYYSEDPVLSGNMAVGVIKGAKSKGVYTYLKHFALNDQETNRDTSGLLTWTNEQVMREIYFLPFEKAVKEGQTTAMMSSFNRIGFTWCGGSYNLLTKLLRDEWGFRGMVVTDYNLPQYMNIDQMVRAGGDVNLSQTKSLSDTSSATAITCIRKATKNILYTVANSNAMNDFGEGVRFYYAAPLWLITLWSVVGVLVTGLMAWGVFIFIKVYKVDKKAKEDGVYPDGAPYTIIKEKKPKTYKLSKPSIIYIIVTAIALIAATISSIVMMALPDKKVETEDPITDSYIKDIYFEINHKKVEEDMLTLDITDTSKYLSVKIDTYGLTTTGYSINSSNEKVIKIGENNQIIPVSVGESVITATVNDMPNIETNLLIKVVDSSIVVDTNEYTITVINGTADYEAATGGTYVTLTPDYIEDATFIGWTFDYEDIWQNGNMFKMPYQDIVVTANYKYKEFNLTLKDAKFEDGTTSKMIEFTKPVPTIIPNTQESIYYTNDILGFTDEQGNFYDESFVMPKKDLTIEPFYKVNGEMISISPNTRNSETQVANEVEGKITKYKECQSTTYTLSNLSTGYRFDILNLSTGTDGFTIDVNETKRLMFTFINKGDQEISINYDVEYGNSDITIPAHSKVSKEIIATDAEKLIRPYHHVSILNDITTSVDLEIFAGLVDVYTIDLENCSFEDGSTSMVLKAGSEIPSIKYDDSSFEVKNYEKVDLVDQDGYTYQKMPYKDITLSPKVTVDGTSFVTSTSTRDSDTRVEGVVPATRVTYKDTIATKYQFPVSKQGFGIDIKNSGSDGFMFTSGKLTNVLLMFYNDGNEEISFTYDIECGGKVEVTIPSKSSKEVIISLTPDTTVRPYHHIRLLKESTQGFDLTVAGYIVNVSSII